ncbi:potassium-transporting ATPase subunit KdpC [Iamia majanohamensis]|uniref:Potassium-transporting ATPase KdpC subunit n=1 Tax=Iamia majanohamensis TaxID=467976 RepID=A0AAE9Y5J3_9ACTN|nr:potassium-transporting ATPase subunit KdpC [Iamia majanohamensis]WCO67160.1 potassium-transporting ATPase subunit KdpC [Iamia majanohamensis]
MLRQARPALVALALFTVLTGLLYPLAVTGIAQAAFGDQADGSPLVVDGERRGSELIAQPFEGEEWFQPRPSAVAYDAASSGASNLGPLNPELLATIDERTAAYRERNELPEGTKVPVDAVTASGSGLDPHISPRNAELQAPRVAEVRGLAPSQVEALVERHTEGRSLGVLGEPRVNVVTLNADLDRLAG